MPSSTTARSCGQSPNVRAQPGSSRRHDQGSLASRERPGTVRSSFNTSKRTFAAERRELAFTRRRKANAEANVVEIAEGHPADHHFRGSAHSEFEQGYNIARLPGEATDAGDESRSTLPQTQPSGEVPGIDERSGPAGGTRGFDRPLVTKVGRRAWAPRSSTAEANALDALARAELQSVNVSGQGSPVRIERQAPA